MKANTSEMKSIASEIEGLVIEYKTMITNLYTKISNLPNSAWNGNQAKRYVRYVLQDKPEMLQIGDRINDFSKAIKDSANILESNSSRIRKGEGNE